MGYACNSGNATMRLSYLYRDNLFISMILKHINK